MSVATIRWEVVTTYQADINLDEHDLHHDDLTEGETLGESVDEVLADLEDEDHREDTDNRIITEVYIDL